MTFEPRGVSNWGRRSAAVKSRTSFPPKQSRGVSWGPPAPQHNHNDCDTNRDTAAAPAAISRWQPTEEFRSLELLLHGCRESQPGDKHTTQTFIQKSDTKSYSPGSQLWPLTSLILFCHAQTTYTSSYDCMYWCYYWRVLVNCFLKNTI